MSEIKLLNCPFCDGDAEIEETITEVDVRCKTCCASIVGAAVEGPTNITAMAELWNTRSREWVPVAERLPEIAGSYLCTYEINWSDAMDRGKMKLARLVETLRFSPQTQTFHHDNGNVCRPTAWQKLPEPYHRPPSGPSSEAKPQKTDEQKKFEMDRFISTMDAD